VGGKKGERKEFDRGREPKLTGNPLVGEGKCRDWLKVMLKKKQKKGKQNAQNGGFLKRHCDHANPLGWVGTERGGARDHPRAVQLEKR